MVASVQATQMDAIPESDTVVHGDFHSKNVMIRNGELVLVDMANLTTGHPLYDLGSMAWSARRSFRKHSFGAC